MSRARIGLLPLYLKLYDDVMPQIRETFDPFLGRVCSGLTGRGIAVTQAPVCRTAPEIGAAVERIAREGADLLVTLHLAYSPSLEALDALLAVRMPVVMLDTTMHAAFGPDTAPDRIMHNHGIHGVQDLASMLRRRGRPYRVVAGHLDDTSVLDRVAGLARAATAASLLRSMRVLRIGESFRGMGDFAVDERVLTERLGIVVDQADSAALEPHVLAVTEDEVEAETARDRAAFVVEAPAEVHRRSARVGLGLRRLLEEREYGAFSVNFLAFDTPGGPVDTVPFLEISKALSRGLGYAGEGDVLTASLVGALNAAFGKGNFVEMFCPDWQGGAVFLSHMGEFNPACAAATPRLIEKDFPWTPARNPAVLVAAPAPGPAILVNLAPGPGDMFGLVVAPVTILGDTTNDAMHDAIRGWMRPAIPLGAFLEQYSELGGTHHCAMVHGGSVEALAAFAEYARIGCAVIGESPAQ
jgi:L-arabinose isomerase